jgi:C4-dicarboxylate transporter, DctM subunit
MMNSALALTQMPAMLARQVADSGFPPVGVMIGIMLFYVALGCVMDELSMIMLTIPVIFPIVMHLDFFGLDPNQKAIWFAILILMVVEIGMIFPPVGLNVYIMNGLARDIPMSETYRGVVPFLISDAIRMALLIAFPSLTLWAVQFVR